jgi:ribosomal protein L6P/L9E
MQNIENYFYTKKIQIPSQVKIQIGNNIITLRGPLGVLELNLKKMDSLCFGFFHVNEKTNELEIYVKKVSKKSKAFFGSLLSFFQNSFHGICQGFLIYLELSGVGFRAILHETMNRRSRVWIGLSGLNASHSNQSIQTMPLIQDGLEIDCVDSLDRSRNGILRNHLSIPSIQEPIIPNHAFNRISHLPDVIIITNPEKNIIVIQEALKYQIPIIGFVDSNIGHNNIQYFIPGNNQSTEFIYFCFNLFVIILNTNNKKIDR